MFTESELSALQGTLDAFCDDRVPIMVRDQVVLQYRFEGVAFILFEKRPFYRDNTKWTTSDIARVTFDRAIDLWALSCRDRNGTWHDYQRLEPQVDIEKVLKEINEDPTGIFWG
jgi:hypothetical protein